jgi:hypothetical protein
MQGSKVDAALQDINGKLTEALGKEVRLNFHPYLIIDEATKCKVVEDFMANTPSLVETMWLAFNRQDNFDYLLSLMKMGFTAKETVQLLPVREGNGEEETSFWELPVNVDGQHRNLLCVCFNADPKISGAFQKAAYPSLWFLQVSSFLPDAPSTFMASEIQGGSWEIQGKDMCGFVGLCAAITEATEKLDLKAPVEKLVDIVSADGSILIKHHLIQPEVQATPGESMAANKEFDPLAAEKTWTFSWRQWMGNHHRHGD